MGCQRWQPMAIYADPGQPRPGHRPPPEEPVSGSAPHDRPLPGSPDDETEASGRGLDGGEGRPPSSPRAGRAGAEEAPIYTGAAMAEVMGVALRVADADVPVVIHGETGVGKELVARFIHERSPRAARPMVSVNCAAIPSQLVESTLFGYERGAFTGAGQRQKGVFEEADGGTVFLDEIGELPLSAQAALLRVLEAGRFARVGSPREIAVDVRVVAASHRDLEAMRDDGRFRADLYYRLSVMVITIPPLRDRPEDVEPLARRFLSQAGGGRIRDLSPPALARLHSYGWPGNVRELRNTIERAALLARGDTIREEDLPARLRTPTPSAPSLPPPALETAAPLPASGGTPFPPLPAVGGLPPDGDAGLGDLRARLQDYEALIIFEVLEATGWNQSEAARRLGMPIRTLSHKVKVLGLKKPSA